MSFSVEIVHEVTTELVDAMAMLVPQLSQSAPPQSKDSLALIVNSPATTLFVARDHSGKVVGSLTLVVFCIPTGVRARLESVVVDGAARGLGVGSALCNAAIKRSRELGAISIDLTSQPSRESANRLYIKLGFMRRETNVYRYATGTSAKQACR